MVASMPTPPPSWILQYIILFKWEEEWDLLKNNSVKAHNNMNNDREKNSVQGRTALDFSQQYFLPEKLECKFHFYAMSLKTSGLNCVNLFKL